MDKVEMWMILYCIVLGGAGACYKYIFDPKFPHRGIAGCLILGPIFVLFVLYMIGEGMKSGKIPWGLVIPACSAVAAPFVLLKLYWDQMNANRDYELRERELLKEEK